MRVTTVAAIGLISASIAATAWAMPGGGGGGGATASTPSRDASQFDAADEYRKGIDALKAQKYSDAKASFKKVLDVAPTDAATNFLAGMADAGLNDLKSAQKHYEKAVKEDKKLVAAHQELGVTYAKLGQKDKAQAELAILQKLDQDCAGTCKDAKAIKDAIVAVQAALGAPTQASLQTNPPLLFASAEAGDSAYLEAVGLINEGKYEQAIVSLDRAKASFGAHPDILTYLGFANRKLGRYDVAISYYRQALAAAPQHKGATEYYGELMVERGDLAGAKAMLAKLDSWCTFGCAESDELRRWIAAKGKPAS
jgi:tetratricopeptide (TPR) repeat protein